MKVKQKTHKNKADKLFSELIRSRGACERCGKRPPQVQLQTSHIISRTYSATRTDPNNSLCLCAGCHFWWHKQPHEAVRWFDERWPGRYDQLKDKSNQITKVDWEAEVGILKDKLKKY